MAPLLDAVDDIQDWISALPMVGAEAEGSPDLEAFLRRAKGFLVLDDRVDRKIFFSLSLLS